jgi:hypothetical protein
LKLSEREGVDEWSTGRRRRWGRRRRRRRRV